MLSKPFIKADSQKENAIDDLFSASAESKISGVVSRPYRAATVGGAPLYLMPSTFPPAFNTSNACAANNNKTNKTTEETTISLDSLNIESARKTNESSYLTKLLYVPTFISICNCVLALLSGGLPVAIGVFAVFFLLINLSVRRDHETLLESINLFEQAWDYRKNFLAPSDDLIIPEFLKDDMKKFVDFCDTKLPFSKKFTLWHYVFNSSSDNADSFEYFRLQIRPVLQILKFTSEEINKYCELQTINKKNAFENKILNDIKNKIQKFSCISRVERPEYIKDIYFNCRLLQDIEKIKFGNSQDVITSIIERLDLNINTDPQLSQAITSLTELNKLINEIISHVIFY